MPDFIYPGAFALLLGIPFVYILRSLKLFSRISFPLILQDWGGKLFVWNNRPAAFARLLSSGCVIIGYICLVIAVANPVIHHEERVYTSRGADIVFVLDTSPSMAARDIGSMTRLDNARQAIHTFVEQNTGVSFGLVVMASEAAVVVPPTMDTLSFFDKLDSIVVGEWGSGSAIGTGLSTAVYHLVASQAPKKCIVLITDGENNAGFIHPETAALLASKYEIAVYLLGIGTNGSVPFEYVDPTTGRVYSGMFDSSFDTRSMEQIALAGNGRYYNVQNVEDLSSVLGTIARHERVVQSYYMKVNDFYYYDRFVLIALIAFSLAWCIRRLYLKEVV